MSLILHGVHGVRQLRRTPRYQPDALWMQCPSVSVQLDSQIPVGVNFHHFPHFTKRLEWHQRISTLINQLEEKVLRFSLFQSIRRGPFEVPLLSPRPWLALRRHRRRNSWLCVKPKDWRSNDYCSLRIALVCRLCRLPDERSRFYQWTEIKLKNIWTGYVQTLLSEDVPLTFWDSIRRGLVALLSTVPRKS